MTCDNLADFLDKNFSSKRLIQNGSKEYYQNHISGKCNMQPLGEDFTNEQELTIYKMFVDLSEDLVETDLVEIENMEYRITEIKKFSFSDSGYKVLYISHEN